MRVWRGDADGGEFRDYDGRGRGGHGGARRHPPHPGHAGARPGGALELQGGRCGSCSAEVNGKPRLMCMTRMNIFPPDEPITVAPLRTFPLHHGPGHRRLVQLREGQARPPRLQARPERSADGTLPDEAGGHRPRAGVPQVHRVLPVPERLPRDPRPRGEQAPLRRAAVLRAAGRAGDAPARHQRPARAAQHEPGSATATSPSAAPRSAPSTSTSPTTRSSRSRSAW